MTCPIDKTAARNEGEGRKRNVLSLLEVHRIGLLISARRALLLRLLAGGSATIDDVRDVVELSPGISPTAFGAVPSTLAKARIIRPVGYAPTARPGAHARPVTIWALADRGKAEEWITQHPEPLSQSEWLNEGSSGTIVVNDPQSSPMGTGAAAATVVPKDPSDLEVQKRGVS